MFRRPLHLSVILAVVTGLLAVAAPAHAAPVSPQLTITIDVWNQSPTREYGTYVPITAQTRGTDDFNGVPGSFEIRRNGAWVSRGWTARGTFATALWEEDPAGTYEFEFEFVPDDAATYLPETKTVTIVRPKAPQGLDLGTPPTDVQAGGSWTLPEPNPANARLAVRSGSTAGACAVSARRVDFTGAGTCTVDVTADEDANHFAAAPRAVTFQVTQAPTVTDVVWSAPSVVIDDPVDLRIALKAGADLVDGSAEVWLGGQRRATVALEGGAADWRTSFPSPGSYEVEVRGTPTDPAYAPSVGTASIQVTRHPQSISAPPSPAYVGDTWLPVASGGGSVSLGSRTPAICEPVNGRIAFRAAGTCQVDSSAGVTATYEAVDRFDSFSVVGVPADVDVTLVPLTTSSQRVEIEVASVRGTPTGTVTFNGTQSKTLVDGRASWTATGRAPGETLHVEIAYAPTAGSTWAAGTTVRDLVVPKVPQPVTISAPPADPRIGQTWTPTITFTSTPMTTSWQASGACVRDGALVRFTAAGDCTVSARHAGSADYLEGTASHTFAVRKVTPTFGADPSPAYVGDTWSPTSSSGGAVSAASATPAVCTTDGGIVRFVGRGDCVVDLAVAAVGDADAAQTRRTVPVTLVPVTVTVDATAIGPSYFRIVVRASSPRGTPTGTVSGFLEWFGLSGAPLVQGAVTRLYLDTLPIDQEILTRFTYAPTAGSRWGAATFEEPVTIARIAQNVAISEPPAGARVGGSWEPSLTWHPTSGRPTGWTASGACTRDGARVRFTAAGDCTVVAVQDGDASYAEGRDEVVLTVLKGTQSIVLGHEAPTSAYAGDAWTPAPTGGDSGRPVSIDADGSCSVSDDVVTFTRAGSCTVTFTQAGTADYEQGERAVTVAVEVAPVALALTAVDDLAVGAEGTLEVGATAGGQVVPGEVTVAGGGISVSGSVGDGPAELPVTFARAGTHRLTVSFEPTDPATYAVAEEQVDVVVSKGAQAITGRQPPETALVGDTWRPSYTGGGSGEPIEVEASGACERTGTLIRFTAAGTCTLTVDQAGDDDWLAAPRVTATTEVGLVPVDVTVTAADDARVGEATALSVVTTAPGTVEVVVDGQTLTGSGPTLPVTFTKAGEREAEVSFTPADPGTHQTYAGTTTLVVAKGAQQLALSEVAPATRRAGGTWTPAVTGGDSDSPVLLAAAPEAVCTAGSGTVRFVTAGDCEVTLTQAGSADYEPAPELRRTVAVERRTPTLTVTLPDDARVGEPAPVTVRSDEEGSVRFALDGEVVGDPVALTDGDATTTLLPTAAGERRVTATFTPDAPGAVAGGEREVTLDVARASTGTEVTVVADGLTATVSPTHLAAGVPTGEVAFAAGGRELGRAELVDGVATLDRPLDPDWAGEVTAAYAGDADRAASTGSVRRTLPTIEASVRAVRPAVRGWYDAPVVVEFACEPGSARPVTCPAPVAVGEGRAQSVTREVTATDGGRATVTVGDLSVDATRPEVAVRGVRAGAVVKGRPRATCRAVDAGSGLASCRVVHRREGRAWVAVATATDRVGHTAVTRVRYRQARVWMPFRPAGEVGTVTRGDRVWLVVLTGGTRPVVTGPLGRSADVVRVRRVRGLTRWHVAVRFPADAERGAAYRVRVRGGGTDEVVRFRAR